jgi:hypothetical protein
MPTVVQFRRGTTTQNENFTGAAGEISIDTQAGTLRVHNGITEGGSNIASVSYVTSAIGALSANSITSGTSNFSIIASGGNIIGNVAGATVTNIYSGGIALTGLLSATGNITGGNILTGGLISATSTITSSATITGGNILTGGLISATGDITGGNLTTAGILTVNSGAAATAIVNGAGNAVGNIGSSGTYFNRLFAQATTALYADLAEVYKSDAKYPPGTVLVFGGSQEVTISTGSHDARIAGVVSTNPAHVMNSGLISEYTVEVGLIGRVPCQVIGPIAAGDRVVSSSRAGVAERLDMQHYQPGVIIGKAVESYNGTSVGTIEVVVGRL